jgi:hypothetical protein
MAQRKPQDLSRQVKKDRQAVQRLRDEIDLESPNNNVRPQQRDINRDAARGDWDRSSRHHDQGMARDETPAEPAPADEYPDEHEG